MGAKAVGGQTIDGPEVNYHDTVHETSGDSPVVDPVTEGEKVSGELSVSQESNDGVVSSDMFMSTENTKVNMVSNVRIVTARYKIYLCVVIAIGLILGTSYYPSVNRNYNSTNDSYKSVQNQEIQLSKTLAEYEQTAEYLLEIENAQDNIKTCINQGNLSVCQLLSGDMTNYPRLKIQFDQLQEKSKSGVLTDDETRKFTRLDGCLNKNSFDECNLLGLWMKGANIPIAFLAFQSLYSQKMQVNEQKVLKNLNEYLIRDGVSTGSRVINGNISSITIGDPKLVNTTPNFYQVPIMFTIEFPTLPELIAFVQNVERKLINNPQDRILYKINEIGYDIIAANKPQTTDISMTAYYYNSPN
ncbi:hypothetical protein AGMMS50249_3000 [candidate division SR1 bacterium]|nr:hypothetical protein AGMMS50249_3000 [candidate division SR1 bacterium]